MVINIYRYGILKGCAGAQLPEVVGTQRKCVLAVLSGACMVCVAGVTDAGCLPACMRASETGGLCSCFLLEAEALQSRPRSALFPCSSFTDCHACKQRSRAHTRCMPVPLPSPVTAMFAHAWIAAKSAVLSRSRQCCCAGAGCRAVLPQTVFVIVHSLSLSRDMAPV